MAGTERDAYAMGSRDAYAGRPAVVDTDDSELMTELGETSPTTARNAGRRGRLIDAYLDGWHTAQSAMGGRCTYNERCPVHPGDPTHGYAGGDR